MSQWSCWQNSDRSWPFMSLVLVIVVWWTVIDRRSTVQSSGLDFLSSYDSYIWCSTALTQTSISPHESSPDPRVITVILIIVVIIDVFRRAVLAGISQIQKNSLTLGKLSQQTTHKNNQCCRISVRYCQRKYRNISVHRFFFSIPCFYMNHLKASTSDCLFSALQITGVCSNYIYRQWRAEGWASF